MQSDQPLPRPTDMQPHYGQHLGDPDYWRPYVTEVLQRHSLPIKTIEPPFVGSFPTFIVGEVVVKLFARSFDGERSSAVERAMLSLLASEPAIPAPRLVAADSLFDAEPRWPYLVIERVRGQAVRDIPLTDAEGDDVAAELGAVVARLHQLAPPPEVSARELIDDLRVAAPERLRRFGLPPHLVEQVPDFLADAQPREYLVHADITADHVYVDEGKLTSLIDWGDALVADRSYELPAVYLDAFAGNQDRLRTFLRAADWPREELPRRGLQGVLEFQFNAIGAIAERIDLSHIPTLSELAERLFDL